MQTEISHSQSKETILWIFLSVINFSVQAEKFLIIMKGGNSHLDFSICSIQSMDEISTSYHEDSCSEVGNGLETEQCPEYHSVDSLFFWLKMLEQWLLSPLSESGCS